MADPNEQTKREEPPEPTSGASAGPPSADKAEDAVQPETSTPPKKRRSQGSTEDAAPRDRNQRIREEAAAKRRARREAEERAAAPARNLDATEIMDDALVRTTHALGGWLKKHFNTVQWVVVLGAVGGIGYQIYSYRRGLTVDRQTDEIARAVTAQYGQVGTEAAAGPDPRSGLTESRPKFPTDEARLKAAEAEYRKAEASTSGTTSALATLGLAGVLYDQGKYKDAQAAYEKVKGSSLAQTDRDARARAIEGIGLSLEAQAKPDAALQAFRELANSEIPGMKDLGEYHQARVLLARGERDKAKDLLKKLVERIGKADEKDRAGQFYVERQARELLESVDPTAVPKSRGLTPEQLERLKQQFKQGGKMDDAQLQQLLQQLATPSGSPPAEPAPGPQSPAPAGSAP
ncbi:MAG TPA: hypothetical protein VIM73_13975 [Polyangiaceae bacterium]